MSVIDTLLMKQVMEQYFLSLKGKRPMTGDLEIANDQPIVYFYSANKGTLGGYIGFNFGANQLYLYTAYDLSLAPDGDIVINTDLMPWLSASYDLGTSSKKWKDVYSSGVAYLTDLQLADKINSHMIPEVHNAYDLGYHHAIPPLQRYWRNLYLSGKATIAGGVDPPYVSFSTQTHESIRRFAKELKPHEKVMLFWNGEKFQYYNVEKDTFANI